jgi:bisphosphoglycerate-dependent phosphoglycerate mutase
MPQGHRGARDAVLARAHRAARVAAGERVLVAAHGNSIRSITKISTA